MAKHGVSLGADIYELRSAGVHLLPTAAAQFEGARDHVPEGISSLCSRSGGLGIGPHGPGSILDSLADQLRKATGDTAANLRLVGEAMEWVAIKQFQHADDAARDEFDRKTVTLG